MNKYIKLSTILIIINFIISACIADLVVQGNGKVTDGGIEVKSTEIYTTNNVSQSDIYIASWDCCSVASCYSINTNATSFLYGGYSAGSGGIADCQRAYASWVVVLSNGSLFNTNDTTITTNIVWVPAR